MSSSKIVAHVELAGFLEGHSDMVNAIVAGYSNSQEDEDAILISGSRDKTLIIWKLDYSSKGSDKCGLPWKCLTGHNHFVTDLTISNDNTFVISSSFDKTMRLWDLRSGKCVRQFNGHKKEVWTVSFSPDNRQIFSGGADKSMNLWNTLAELKMSSSAHQSNNQQSVDHSDWVSKVRFSQSQKTHYYASVGWDGRLKIWSGIFKLTASIKAHESYINALAISKNGMFIATGGKDQLVKIWDYVDLKQAYLEFKCESIINGLAFNTNFQWLAAATDSGVKIWDICSDSNTLFADFKVNQDEDEKKGGNGKGVKCMSLCWSANGKRIYVGCSDGLIRILNVTVRVG